MQILAIDLGFPDGIPRLTEGAKVRTPVAILYGKRGTHVDYGVQFFSGGAATLLPDGSLLRFTVKKKGQYDSDAVVSAWDGDWTTPGSAAGYYTATINWDTDALKTLLASPNADPTDDIAADSDLMGAFSWGLPGDPPTETEEFQVKVLNLINNEGTSAATPAGAHPSPLITLGYTGGGADNLDGIPTTALTPPALLVFYHASDGLCHYVLTAGTTAASSPDIIHPTDYDAGTNAKFWKSAL